jgi:hypothetical protein
MAEPLIYVGTHAIQPGKVDVARAASRDLATFLEANHPDMLHFGIYIDADASEMTVIQIHPDEASLAKHLELAARKIAAAYEFLSGTTHIDIYGSPSDSTVAQIQQMAMGAPLSFNTADAGFTRLAGVPV